MWSNRSQWSRLFNNRTAPINSDSLSLDESQREIPPPFQVNHHHNSRKMDPDEVDYVQIVPFQSYDTVRAKQRATIKWLLSKAYNNKIPEELSEPFYKDHEGEEHLKPHIVQGLSNAELYCNSLCNIYADPNFSQLSPWGIVQALARKGSYVQASADIQLTETVLIQNTPIKITAHMAVLEAMMVLQVREIISNERVMNTVQRYGPNVHPLRVWLGSGEMPSDAEEALLLWINRSVLAIKDFIQNNNAHEHNLSSSQVESWSQLPLFQDLTDLADGVGLCSLLAFYCQEELALSEISVPNPGEPLSVSDSLWNLQLVQRVCRDSLPYNVCHFTFEDVLYLHESMKQNMLNFLADLFNQLELQPAQCVKLLGSHQMIPIRPAGLTAEGVRMRRGFIQQSPITIPDLRPSLYSYQTCASSSAASSSDRNAMSSRPQSATSTPKRQLSVKERSQRSAHNIFGEQTNTPPHAGGSSGGRRSPSNASVVSIPLRRSTTPHDYSDRAHSEKSGNQKDHRYYAHSRSSEESEDFVVHRGRNVPTLSQVIRSVSPSSQDERSSPASRMSISRRDPNASGAAGASSFTSDPNDSDGLQAAGRPSDFKAHKTTYAGRRSRRNSITEADSQLTVENFGGSQDNLNRFTIAKNPDKQPAIVTDSTVSPIRFVKRQHSQEPPDYYSSPDPQPQSTPSPVVTGERGRERERGRDPSKRASMCESGGDSSAGGGQGGGNGGGGDVVFYGKKKLSVTMDQYEQEHYERMNSTPRRSDEQSHGQPSGNFNQFQPSQNNHHDLHQQNNHSPPQENGNVTVYVMNKNDHMGGGGGGGPGGLSGDAPLRSLSMTNLSRLSDLPNKPINIVYLQSSEGNTPPSSSASSSNNPPPVSHSYRVSNSSNGWGGGGDGGMSQYGSPDYHTLPAGRAHNQPQYNTPPQHYQQQYHQQNPYAPQVVGGPQSHHPQYSPHHQQHQQQYQSHQNRYSSPHRGGGGDEDFDTDDIAAQLNAIRFKLEEKRKRIEMEKTKMETIVSKQQAKLGKAAYLKALNKGKGGEGALSSAGGSSSSSSNASASQLLRGSSGGGHGQQALGDHAMISARKKQLSLKPIYLNNDFKLEDFAVVRDLESKWLAKTDEPCRTPEIENMDIETYQRSLARMDCSLTELETDIGRLTQQQEQIHRQFFLHGDQQAGGGVGGPHSNNDTAKRKTWTVPTGGGGGGDGGSGGGRAPPSSSQQQQQQQPPHRSQWGNPKPYGNNNSSDSDNTNNPPPPNDNMTPPRVVYNGDVRTAAAPHLPSSRGGGSAVGSGGGGSGGANNNTGSLSYSSSFRLHSNADTQGNRLFGRQQTTEETDEPPVVKPTPPPRQRNSAAATMYHAPLPTPPPDDMEPQSVSFVQDDTTPLANELGSMSSGSGKKSSMHQITSGSKTYRITPESGSPPRPPAHRLFTSDAPAEGSLTSSDENPSFNERGFYIALDSEAPKRPKPPLRTRSPAKRRESGTSGAGLGASTRDLHRRDLTTEYIQSIVDHVPIRKEEEDDFEDQENRFYGHGRHHEDGEICDAREKPAGELVIDEKPQLDPEMEYEMEKKKERILMLSLKRQQQVEDNRRVKEMETQRKRDIETAKQEEKLRKREEEKARRQAILDSYRMKKQEEMEKDTKGGWEVQESSAKKFMRPKSSSSVGTRPRPKTIHLSEVDSAGPSGSETPRHGTRALRRSDSQTSSTSLARSYGKRGSSNTLYSGGGSSRSGVRDPWGSTSSLNQETRRRPASSNYDRRSRTRDLSTSRLEVRSRRDSYLGSQESLAHHRHNSTSSLLDGVETDASSSAGGGHNNRDSDSGVGTCSPPARRRSPSPATVGLGHKVVARKNLALGGLQHHPHQPSCSLPSPSGNGPGSLPPGLISRRHRGFDDGASDISSVASSNMDYSGLRLYKQPTAKSNRSIILNAVEYCVFPGVVNRDAKMKVLDEINRSESKHFLVMFRDAGCQFRALYSYIPETEEVIKLYGVGPKQVNDRMFEKFFKYNSGGKCFTQVHTKHLTVTIDAFTIHNALWIGKKLPTVKTKDMALVI